MTEINSGANVRKVDFSVAGASSCRRVASADRSVKFAADVNISSGCLRSALFIHNICLKLNLPARTRRTLPEIYSAS